MDFRRILGSSLLLFSLTGAMHTTQAAEPAIQTVPELPYHKWAAGAGFRRFHSSGNHCSIWPIGIVGRFVDS